MNLIRGGKAGRDNATAHGNSEDTFAGVKAVADKVILEARSLRHTYRSGREALRGVDVTIRAGEMIALIGRNGAGKTTLTKHFNGLLKPTAGTVLVDGQDTGKTAVARLARTVGYVFQNPDHMIFHDTLFDEVAFGPRNLGLTGADLVKRVETALAAVGLEGFRDSDPALLSRGQRKRAALAAVLAMETPVIIVDEPTSGQDFREARQIMAILQQLHRRGHAVLFITHDMELVHEYAHRVLALDDGQITLDAPPAELFRHEAALQSAGLRLPLAAELARRLAPFGVPATVDSVDALAATVARLAKARLGEQEDRRGRVAACQ
ncbi:ATP-binding cassette domain-containing protein [Heliobacterium gestii]|uniref:ATP-binding cassette domain-containing protein n=1 Tax=Heliomicrobium gestii TaxID=2699 RepID=A0A845LBD3_HELGE|nr:ABC transporter ATP-binding protein [Heliomicrobium gestii]MBM7866333.1 energy-coupling factor transport system ATP-binding protein [Heliomicrobium gestii]MZP42881.1 ATP-binding cassette domain-containing protein [Heliomicrobium gestii]